MHAGALFDLSPFTKIDISGPNAGVALQRLCSNSIDVPEGKIVYTLMLNERGGIEAEATVTRLEESRWRLVTGAATRMRDLDRLRRLLPKTVTVGDVTENQAVLGVMGPNSLAVMREVLDKAQRVEEMTYGWCCKASIGGSPLRVARISYVGEHGYELFIPVADAGKVLQAVLEPARRHGLGFAGHFCVDSCRLEKGYLHWGHDIGPDDDPLSAGLGFAVRLDGDFDFIGRNAIERLRAAPRDSHLTLFAVDAEAPLLLHDEPLLRDGMQVGRTTSGGLGFRTGMALVMGYVSGPLDPAAHWQINVAGELLAVRPLAEPPYDPKGERMKS